MVYTVKAGMGMKTHKLEFEGTGEILHPLRNSVRILLRNKNKNLIFKMC